ncbi:MAG: IS110 family transposase [Eubacteriales bacterium]|jgi:transposase
MRYYIGVDNHKKFSYMSVMDEKGMVVKEGKVVNTKEAVSKFLGREYTKDTSAVLEAGRNWTVMYDWLEEELDEVKLAHPLKVKAIAKAKIKTDKIDAKTLAHLLRCDLVPEAHVPDKDTRNVKNILRQRMFLVKVATMIKNRIHLIIDRHPEVKNQINPSDLFGKQGLEWLKLVVVPKEDRRILDEELDLLSYLNEKIDTSNSWVGQIGKGDSKVNLLMTIPGIGKFFALLIANEIDDITRFRDKTKLASYAGLIPSVHASAGKIFHGRIIKHGNKYLRWALIEAVWPAIRKDLSLREYYESLKLRKGANQAKVAVARRLSIIVYRVLSQKRSYVLNYSGCPHATLAKAAC